MPWATAMNKIDYDAHQHRSYQAGRAHPDATLQRWMALIASRVGDRTVDLIVDVGAGTGRFSTRLAGAFGARVVGVEPSDRMRALAEQGTHDPRVSYLRGEATRIPLEPGCATFAFMSMVLHHVTEPQACARELHRVVQPGGFVFIRNAFQERLETIRYHEYFPRTRAIDAAWLPSIAGIQQCFADAGFEVMPAESVTYEVDASLADYCARIETRAISTLEHLSEEEFQAGLAALRQAAARAQPPAPVCATLDLLGFRKPERPQLP
jgi:ubiquinone/menaquinone biosynthesis C-methylase UbiE